jgi:hypothetical protein
MRARELGGDPSTPGGEARADASARERTGDLQEAVVKVGLSADQDHVPRAQVGELSRDLEGLGRRELARARRARP